MLDHAIGPNIITGLTSGLQGFLERHVGDGWRSVEDFRGLRRDRIVTHSKIRRPDSKEYFGGHNAPEGYAAAEGNEKPVQS
jgi:dihydropyrimidine dehydrogenase (NAD+) subunit PreA